MGDDLTVNDVWYRTVFSKDMTSKRKTMENSHRVDGWLCYCRHSKLLVLSSLIEKLSL